MRAGLDSAFAGRGRVALGSGEAGIGKSATAGVIAADAEARGAVVTWGRAWEFADAPPYFPLWPCFRALGVGGAEGDRARDEEGAFHLWEAVAAALARESAATPRVWILEDLHAADLGTLDLLTFLAQPLKAMRALVVATVRSRDPHLTERMQQRLTRMARDGLDVRLEALGEQDVAAVTRDTLGRAVPATALRRLVDLTGGNPLFVVECARAFRRAGGVEGTLGALPPTVRQVVLDRVALLPASAQNVLAAGAILGREFSAASVARMNQTLPARAIDALLPALRAGLVDEARPGHFVFSHALVRDAIDEALGAEERAGHHARAAAALSGLGDAVDVLVERARHTLAALPSGDASSALAIAERAAELLERERAFDRAFELHARVEEARASGFLPPAARERRLHVARIARAAGRSDACRRMTEEVVAAARASGDVELFAHAALLLAADIRPAVIDRAQVALLEEVREALGDRAPALGARVLARLATALQPAPDPSIPCAMAHEARRRAEQTGDDAAILDVLDLGKWGLFYSPIADRVAWSTELLERALRADDLPKALGAREWLAFQHMERGDFDAFGREVKTQLALADETGHPRHRWRPLLMASAHATALGHFAEADRHLAEVTALAALVDDPALPFALAMHEATRLRIQWLDDRLPAALDAAAEVAPAFPASQIVVCVRARCSDRLDGGEGARAAVADLRVHAPTVQNDPISGPYWAEVWAMAGNVEERRAARSMLAASPTREVSGGQASFHYEGSVPRLIGLLDHALGDLTSARIALGEALVAATARKHLPWVAQIAVELAAVERSAGDEAAARVLLAQAAGIARELGMTGLERRLGVAPSASAPEPRGLAMEKEGEVWRIGKGATIVRVRDSRGVQLLARLVERPGEEIHVLALSSDEGAGIAESSAGELLDEQARAAYRTRLADLEEELAEAERDADRGRLAKLERERDALGDEHARAVGLGGRARKAASATERARVNVQRRVKDAIGRIREADEGLGRFLEKAVTTGVFCVFRP